jgi:hypothetical protein
MKRLIFILFALLPIVLPSCSDDVVGEWDPMVWQLSESKSKLKTTTFEVSAAGETYNFYCKNYSGYWVSNIRVDGEYVAGLGLTDDFDESNVTTTWCDVVVNGHYMTVTVKPNTSGEARNIALCVTAGDIFDYFTFKQAAE